MQKRQNNSILYKKSQSIHYKIFIWFFFTDFIRENKREIKWCKIFTSLGIRYKIINNNPNGININDKCGSTHIEFLQKYVVENKLNMGFAYDGDGDRCLAVDEKGNLIDSFPFSFK